MNFSFCSFSVSLVLVILVSYFSHDVFLSYSGSMSLVLVKFVSHLFTRGISFPYIGSVSPMLVIVVSHFSPEV